MDGHGPQLRVEPLEQRIVLGVIVSMVLSLIQIALSFLGSFGDFVISAVSLVVLIYLACRFVIIVPVIAVDGERNPINAMRRSWALTQANIVQIFIVMLVVAVAAIILGLVAVLLLGGFFFSAA